MEEERNTTQYHHAQDGEIHQEKPSTDDQVEVKERGFLGSLLGRKKAPEDDQDKKQQEEEELASGVENIKVSYVPAEHSHEEIRKEEHHDGGEKKKESLLAKLHRTSSSSSSSSSDEEEEVIDENGEIVKRKKKKGLKEKIKEKLPGHKNDVAEGEHKPYAAPVHQEPQHKPYVPAPAPAHHHQEPEHKPYAPPPVETHAHTEDDYHKAYVPAAHAPVTTTHVHENDNATVVQKVEETPEKGLLEKIKEKLPGGHKKQPAEDAEDVSSSPDGKDKEKKQGLLGKIMDKIPGYNKGPVEEEHKYSAGSEQKTGGSY